jgi:hypothetical protein
VNAAAVARSRAVAVPAWIWLTAIVVVSTAARIALGHRIVTPWIMVDELVYSELAKSFAAHGSFLVRDVPSNGYGFVYPILIAPAFRLSASVPHAYAVAKGINAVAMSLTAVPAYFLARRLLPQSWSLAAATLSVLIPSLLYTGTLMTENVFYPLFVLACLAIMLMLERPTGWRQVGVLAVCAVCFATRAQAVALFGAAVIAPVLHGWIERDLRSRLRRYAVLYGLVGAGVVLALAGTVLRGRSPLSLLGAYRAATDAGYSVSDVLHYVLWHFAELDLFLGVVGFAALLALWFAPRAASPAARAFTAMSLPVVLLLVVEVAIFASRQSFRIEERNDFYVAPLAIVALLMLPRAGRSTWVAAAIAGVLPLAIPFARFVNPSAVSDTIGLLPWWWLQDQGIHFGPLRIVALAVGVGGALLFALVPRRYLAAVAVLLGVYFVLATIVAENGRHGFRQASAGSLWAGIRLPHYDWIDRRVGRDANVSFLWHYAGETRPLWNNEFFNRSVGGVYTLDGPDPADGGLPETPVHERGDGVLVDGHGSTPRVRYAVAFTDIAGRLLQRDAGIGLGLYRVDGPLVILTRVTGLYPNDTWGRRVVTYRRLRCPGGSLAVRVGSDEHLFDVDQVVTAHVAGRAPRSVRIQPGAQPTLRVPLVSDNGVCSVRFTAARVRVPGGGDTRPLAAHYFAFDYSR